VRLHIGKPCLRAYRAPDAFRTAERGIAQRLVELVSQESREIACPLEPRRYINEATTRAGYVRRRA